jgi:hypothetical protein
MWTLIFWPGSLRLLFPYGAYNHELFFLVTSSLSFQGNGNWAMLKIKQKNLMQLFREFTDSTILAMFQESIIQILIFKLILWNIYDLFCFKLII